MTAGVDVAAWPYWQPAARAADLHASVLNDVTSVMDIGIMLGALAASALAGRFAPVWRVPAAPWWRRFWAASCWAMVRASRLAATSARSSAA